MTETLNQEIGAVEDLSVFDGHQHEVFYQSAEFWVGMAFVLVVVGLAKPLGKTIKSLLIKRRDNIQNQLDEAQKLRDDAQLLLAQYERQFLNAQNETDVIFAEAKTEIENIKAEQLERLENELNLQRRDAQNKMRQTTAAMQKQMAAAISQNTTNLVQIYMTQFLDKQKQSDLIDASVDAILNTLQQK